jgi:hypothetical protein
METAINLSGVVVLWLVRCVSVMAQRFLGSGILGRTIKCKCNAGGEGEPYQAHPAETTGVPPATPTPLPFPLNRPSQPRMSDLPGKCVRRRDDIVRTRAPRWIGAFRTIFIAFLLLAGCSHQAPVESPATQASLVPDVSPSLPAEATPEISQGVHLHWLDRSAPAIGSGVSWGVPWPEGKVMKDAPFALTDGNEVGLPLQSWTLAYWPDGSIKWTGFATIAKTGIADTLKVTPGRSYVPLTAPLQITQSEDAITITNGTSVWQIGKTGHDLVRSISLGNRVVATNGRLVGDVEDRSQWDSDRILKYSDFTSEISTATIEQIGPVRAVIKVEGKHNFVGEDRQWLPFVVRLYFYAGVDSVRMVHTFIFDGDQEKDFIHSLGVRFDVPMREELQNRHVRIAGDQGFLSEPVRLIAGRRDPRPRMYEDQIAGKRIPNLDQLPRGAVSTPGAPPPAPPAVPASMGNLVQQMAVWDSYKLTQLSPDGFEIDKRTNAKSAWIRVLGGQRSAGAAFVGDVSGGLAIDMKNFWKLYPTEMEISNAGKDSAELTVYLWSPEAPAMDMRHYDTIAHGLEASYEDVQPGHSNSYGVARTSELTIRPFNSVPSDADLWRDVQVDQRPPMLVCAPEYYHALKVFGVWSLPDRSTAAKAWVEDQLDKAFAFYHGQVEERRWYGFWDFGDFMHTYDGPRHEWKYDIGGFAWDDTELSPNVWLWYSFLRSGRADIFRMAEALTRQSQEVDVYHIGPWKGLGSRHNVRHWGDGAKEVRISQSLFKRFYYYLTTDERVGDLMNEEIDADKALLNVDPLHELPGIAEDTANPTHLRIGPDWLALVSNWYTAWERTGDTQYRDRIMAGMKSITAMPNGILSGENYGYDPATHELKPLHVRQETVPSLLSLFGGPELMTEIIPVINDPAWTAAWLKYCEHDNGREADHARLTAYAASVTGDANKAAQAWEQFFHVPATGGALRFDSHVVDGPIVAEPVDEISNVSTNSTSQWCLNAIELLQLVPGQIPARK